MCTEGVSSLLLKSQDLIVVLLSTMSIIASLLRSDSGNLVWLFKLFIKSSIRFNCHLPFLDLPHSVSYSTCVCKVWVSKT